MNILLIVHKILAHWPIRSSLSTVATRPPRGMPRNPLMEDGLGAHADDRLVVRGGVDSETKFEEFIDQP